MKWISVEERLPEENDVVLVYCFGIARQGYKKALAIIHNGFWFIGECTSGMHLSHQLEPIYWMPLPEPPESETDDKGCEYCRNETPYTIDIDTYAGDYDYVYIRDTDYKYCPYCGRDLESEE